MQLSERQARVVGTLVAGLARLDGVLGVALGGSRARGRAREGSDVDLGVLYSEAAPFSIEALRALAERWSDVPGPVVTQLYEWGPWVNGGAWLCVEGERVDLLYRSAEHLERAIADGEAGRHAVHHGQQPPFGYWSGTALGELAICAPLHDPAGRLAALKARVARYPEALHTLNEHDFPYMLTGSIVSSIQGEPRLSKVETFKNQTREIRLTFYSGTIIIPG